MRRSAEIRDVPLAKHELIGLGIRVRQGRGAEPSSPYRDVTGIVVDETRNTLVVETASGDRVVPKIGQCFVFTLPDGREVDLEGARIAFNPEDRIKKSR